MSQLGSTFEPSDGRHVDVGSMLSETIMVKNVAEQMERYNGRLRGLEALVVGETDNVRFEQLHVWPIFGMVSALLVCVGLALALVVAKDIEDEIGKTKKLTNATVALGFCFSTGALILFFFCGITAIARIMARLFRFSRKVDEMRNPIAAGLQRAGQLSLVFSTVLLVFLIIGLVFSWRMIYDSKDEMDGAENWQDDLDYIGGATALLSVAAVFAAPCIASSVYVRNFAETYVVGGQLRLKLKIPNSSSSTRSSSNSSS